VPESHYNLARYFHEPEILPRERKALDNAVLTSTPCPPRGQARGPCISTGLIWRGRFLVQRRNGSAPSETTRPRRPNTRKPSSSGA